MLSYCNLESTRLHARVVEITPDETHLIKLYMKHKDEDICLNDVLIEKQYAVDSIDPTDEG